MNIVFYTDGACSQINREINSKNPGAFAIIGIENNNIMVKYSEFHPLTTSNRMELLGVLWVLQSCNFENLIIYSDSQYVVNGFNIWRHNWIKKNWKTAGNTPVLNLGIWLKIHETTSSINKNIKLQWVKAHNNDYYNDMVDALAKNTIIKKSSTVFIEEKIKSHIVLNK